VNTLRRFLPAIANVRNRFLPAVASTPGRFLPAIASTPRRAVVSATLIAGLAAGPLAGTAATSGSAFASQNTPSQSQLMPDGVPGGQAQIPLDSAQRDNAKAIVKATQEMKLPPRAAVIAVATSMQETKLNNYGDLGTANDHDSLGLFQQRPSAGWGTPQQLTNPDYSTKAFLKGLTNVDGWQTMPLTDAAQAVQVSAFGDRYAQWEKQAADLVQADYHG
jgi:hypothetical protein